jgi:SpoVK/Ycf46/Vps4 family AAA+-type ATPase
MAVRAGSNVTQRSGIVHILICSLRKNARRPQTWSAHYPLLQATIYFTVKRRPHAKREAIDEPALANTLDELVRDIALGTTLASNRPVRAQAGCMILLHGTNGTGKTMDATMLGKNLGRTVFRVDLSAVVSKYIGETEKNLDPLFEAAAAQDAILFLDEADALFGTRTSTRHADDRFANMAAAYVLQRLETFPGVAILSSKRHVELDPAFTRRCRHVIEVADGP